ncbi:substrate-binding periplasmic protein [Zooshikella sp. RANM57]|uniref:substrate-binding periplasmic protein n=1 Tax=Zooshikella sp. RANM57 TaxID=3425863 RepID=UPI003D6FC450
MITPTLHQKLVILSVLFWLNTTYADYISIGIPNDKPPYAFNQKGILYDIFTYIFKKGDYKLKFIPMSNTAMDFNLRKSKINASAFTHKKYEQLFYSEPYIALDDVVITLKKHNLTIATINDLNGLDLLAWKGASKVLGKQYQILYQKNKALWFEVPSQKLQNQMFWQNKTKVIVCDLSIFLWMKKKLQSEGLDTQKPYTIHRIFPLIYQQAGFTNKKLKDLFNRNLLAMKQSGIYKSILQSYLSTD